MKLLEDQGIKVLCNHAIVSGENKGEDGVILKVRRDNNEIIEMETDILLLSIGRSPNSDGLECEKAGVNLNPRGMIETNDTW